ncbi:response regulator transcription factor [Flaviaesturariibacter amylovorans]|uniref:Response regulator transcription factor n=1 Tax=Flaviaesturariibacter amylovorans TaxID=1084520 RepID=A0ABP8HF99_9BACT
MIRVLLYDDHEHRRRSLEALLSLSPHIELLGAFPDCSGVQEDIRMLAPDVVLMDIEMPGIDGIEAVRLIRAVAPGVRIIMQTVFEDAERIFAALRAGAQGYILKSAGPEKILQSIEEVHAGGAFMTPSVALQVIQFFDKPAAPQAVSYELTAKEQEVLGLLSEGKSYKMVADALGISYSTVNSHVKKIYEKLHVHSLGEAVSLAIKNKIV